LRGRDFVDNLGERKAGSEEKRMEAGEWEVGEDGGGAENGRGKRTG